MGIKCVSTAGLALCASLFGFSVARAVVPVYQWSRGFGGPSTDTGYSVAVDAAGNVFLAGTFFGTVDAGGGNLVSAGSTDIVLAKYDAGGNHLWSKRVGGPSSDVAVDIAVDPSGNVAMAGYFSGTADFGGGNLVSAGGSDIVIATYDAGGTHLWSRRAGGPGTDQGYGVAVDAGGNVIATGYFSGTINLGGANLVSAGSNDAFLAKYDAAGVHQWSRRLGGTSGDLCEGVAVDASGNIIIAGYFQGTTDFGGGPLVSAGNYDGVLATYDAAGNHIWSKRVGGTSIDLLTDVAVDAAGRITVGGSFQGSADFGGGALVSAGGYDAVIARYDGAGAYQWSQRYGSTGTDQCRDLAVDGPGHVNATGAFSGSVNFGGGNLASAGGTDIFTLRLDADGSHQWSLRFGGSGADAGIGLARDALGNVFVTGSYTGSVDFGGGALANAGVDDVFLFKYRQEDPIPVLISSFSAVARAGGVDIQWSLWNDEPLDRYELYRWADALLPVIAASGDARTTRGYHDSDVAPGASYDYQLVVYSREGSEFRSPSVRVTVAAQAASLSQNVPNPFNPRTSIAYALPSDAVVTIEIFDVSGARVRRLDQGGQRAGAHQAEWDGRDEAGHSVASGVYFYRLAGMPEAGTRRMVLLK